jgi:hypothetical protein
MDAVILWGNALVTDPDRVGTTTAIGVDETSFLSATATERTRWVSSICDVAGRIVIDMIEGRQAPDLDRWLAERPQEWIDAVAITVCDLHEPFRAALARHLPDAIAVADPFHVVAVGTRCVDATRRRTQNDTLGHRGRKGDPLYRCRKLLAMAEERLDEAGSDRLRGLLAAGDPLGHVHEAWRANYPALGGAGQGRGAALAREVRRRRWLSRLVMTRWWRAVSEVQSRASASSRSWWMSVS